MIHRHPLREPRSPAWLPALAAACAIALLAGDGAEASCGDWLEGHAVASPRGPTDAGTGLGERAGRGGVFADAVPLERPCDGPACRRAPAAPSVPVEVADAPIGPERAIASGDDAAAGSSAASVPRPTDDPRIPSADRGRPERPPRGR